jgi:hypothetical protein
MDVTAIMELIVKGLGVISALVAAGENAEPAIETLVKLAQGQQDGTVTDEQLASTEATLDGLIDDFNLPMTKPGGTG